jgi:hypothetical protein
MQRVRHPAIAILPLALLGTVIAGCSPSAAGTDAEAATTNPTEIVASAGTPATGTTGSTTTGTVTTALAGTHDTAADYEWDAASEIAISLADAGMAAGDGVAVEGSVVTITAAGTYRVTGSLSNGQLVVDTDAGEPVRLVLDGVSIANATGPAIAVLDADKVIVILESGSENVLADGATSTTPNADVDEPNAALYSAADLTIAGDGALTVTGSYDDGITSKDGLVIAGGTITVSAMDDGIRGKDYLVVNAGALAVTAGGDALKSDTEGDATLGYVLVNGGTLTLDAGTDAIDAISTAVVAGGSMSIAAGDDGIHSDTRLEIAGGTIDITRSYEGLEGTQIVITGGTTDVTSQDDGLNVAGGDAAGDPMTAGGRGDTGGFGPGGGGPGGPGGEQAIEGYFVDVSGGTLLIDAGGDGFDSNGSANVTGGTIVVNGPTERNNGALDVNGEFLVSDATVVAAGSAGMAETPSTASEQAILHLRFNQEQAAGTVVQVHSPDGSIVVTVVPTKPFQSIVLSTPGLVEGQAYEVFVGGTASGESLGGLHPDSGVTGGTSLGSVTAG